ncbi:apical ring associated protein 1, putative [Plasmodium gaboni]|uniref:Apical ring associated protein 1, putative n=1 Tax=Plasmodium gaboni TaxID=647221 RepID=A0ABY1US75_9APIC|nr:apical ring associated protein 1, putative [Plasmodium gaboni]
MSILYIPNSMPLYKTGESISVSPPQYVFVVPIVATRTVFSSPSQMNLSTVVFSSPNQSTTIIV